MRFCPSKSGGYHHQAGNRKARDVSGLPMHPVEAQAMQAACEGKVLVPTRSQARAAAMTVPEAAAPRVS